MIREGEKLSVYDIQLPSLPLADHFVYLES